MISKYALESMLYLMAIIFIIFLDIKLGLSIWLKIREYGLNLGNIIFVGRPTIEYYHNIDLDRIEFCIFIQGTIHFLSTKDHDKIWRGINNMKIKINLKNPHYNRKVVKTIDLKKCRENNTFSYDALMEIIEIKKEKGREYNDKKLIPFFSDDFLLEICYFKYQRTMSYVPYRINKKINEFTFEMKKYKEKRKSIIEEVKKL